MKDSSSDSIRLIRDVNAYMVPSGDEVKLLEGNLVRITQALGGNYTVLINGNMVQIRAENADALGIEIKKENTVTPSGDIEKQIVDGLEVPYQVIDIATADLGACAHRKYDIEAYMTMKGDDTRQFS